MLITRQGLIEENIFQERRNQVEAVGFFAIWRYTSLLSPMGVVLLLQFFDWFVTGFIEVSLYPYVTKISGDFSKWSSFLGTIPRTIGFVVVLFIRRVGIHPIELCLLAPVFTATGWFLYLIDVISFGQCLVLFVATGKVLWAGGHLPILGQERRNFAVTARIPLDFRVGGIYLFAGKGIGGLLGSFLGSFVGTNTCFVILFFTETVLIGLAFVYIRHYWNEIFRGNMALRIALLVMMLGVILAICYIAYCDMNTFMTYIVITLGIILSSGFLGYGVYLLATSHAGSTFNVGIVFFAMIQMEFVFGIVRYMTDYISSTITNRFISPEAFGIDVASSRSDLFSLRTIAMAIPWMSLVAVGFSWSFYFVRRVPIMIRYIVSVALVIPLLIILAQTLIYCNGQVNIIIITLINTMLQLVLALTYSEILNAVFCYIPHGMNANTLMVLMYEFHSLSGNTMRVILSGFFFEPAIVNQMVNLEVWVGGLYNYIILLAVILLVCIFTWIVFLRRFFNRLEESLSTFGTITEVYIGRRIDYRDPGFQSITID